MTTARPPGSSGKRDLGGLERPPPLPRDGGDPCPAPSQQPREGPSLPTRAAQQLLQPVEHRAAVGPGPAPLRLHGGRGARLVPGADPRLPGPRHRPPSREGLVPEGERRRARATTETPQACDPTPARAVPEAGRAGRWGAGPGGRGRGNAPKARARGAGRGGACGWRERGRGQAARLVKMRKKASPGLSQIAGSGDLRPGLRDGKSITGELVVESNL